MPTKVFYIASAKTYEVKGVSGSVLTVEDEVAWLGISEGYRQCFLGESSAHHFKTEQEIQKDWMEWDGMPWYFRLKPNSLTIICVTEVKTLKRTIEVVKGGA